MSTHDTNEAVAAQANAAVSDSKHFATTALILVSVVALLLIGSTAFAVSQVDREPEKGVLSTLKSLKNPGVINYYSEAEDWKGLMEAMEFIDPEEHLDHPWVAQRDHVDKLADGVGVPNPPAGGNHFPIWARCMGDVYTEPLDNGNAIHSLEHGAVWLTYDPAKLSADDVELLASHVAGRAYTFMSPYPTQEKAVSLQAWGLQYPTDDVNDPGIDYFFNHFVRNDDYNPEPHASCEVGDMSEK